MSYQLILDLLGRQTLQVSIVILAAGVLTPIVCRRRPHLAYVLWLAVLLKALTPPLWTSPTGIFTWAAVRGLNAAHMVSPALQAVAPVRHAAIFAPVSASAPASQPVDGHVLLLKIWAVGAVAFALIVVAQWLILRRRIDKSSIRPSREILTLAQEVRQSLGLRRAPVLRLCQHSVGPAVVGVFRPVLVIPANILQCQSLDQLRPILAHELIHLRRGDPVAAFLQFLAQCVWWFNPLVWWMNRQINRTRELCCDEEVIALRQCSPSDYSQMLINILRMRQCGGPLGYSLGIRSASVTLKRLSHIMNPSIQSKPQTPRAYWLAFAGSLLVLLPGAGFSLPGGSGRGASVASADTVPDSTPPTPSTQPGVSTTVVVTTTHYVRVVVDNGLSMSFQGQPTNLAALASQLQQIPDPPNTVIEIAYASDAVTMAEFNRVQSTCIGVVQQLHFKYLSNIGQQDMRSKGPADSMTVAVPAPSAGSLQLPPQPGDANHPFTPVAAPESELTHRTNFQLNRNTVAAGDDIRITEIRGTSDQFAVNGTYRIKGTYTLQSCDSAKLAAWTTATQSSNDNSRVIPGQEMIIHRGSGEFTLNLVVPYVGDPHITLYTLTTAQNIGGVYLGSATQ